jgi:hypothetical protein
MEWRVDEDRKFEFRRRLGSDKSRTLELVAGKELAGCEVRLTTVGLVNDLLGIGGDADAKDAQVYAAYDSTSIRRLRRRQGTQRYVDLLTKSTLRPRVKADVRKLAVDPGTIRTTVVRGTAWASVREGDSVALNSPAANAVYKARAQSLAVDPVAGIMDVTWIAEGTL